jgi:hypothetical protein
MVLLVMLSLSFSFILTPASAGLTDQDGGGELFFSCRADNDCVLTPTPVGEEQVSGQSTANTFQSETLTFEFEADPPQDHVAVLPDMLASMEVDFKHQTEAGSLFRPALEIRLILGENVNTWSFDSSPIPNANAQPYTIENEQMSLSKGRVLWAEEQVKVLITVTLDQPGTWSFNMRGASSMLLEIPWSLNPSTANVDEPTSTTQPRSTSFEDVHRGALVGADHDCWAFEVETHEVLRLTVDWNQVPLELEQPHPVPELITAAGRLSPTPDVLVDDDGESKTFTYRWRALPTGDYTLCMHGSPEKLQSYVWSGLFGYESMGPTDPSGFESVSFYPQGAALIGDLDNPHELSKQGFGLLLLSVLLLVIFLVVAWRPTTSYGLRFGVFVPGVILLMVGGVLHPLWAIADEVQHAEEITLDDLIEMRLQQLWDVSAEGVPDQTLYTHTGATWGMLPGETLRLKLDVNQAIPLGDGRYQLLIEELEDLRLDQVIFGQVAKGAEQQSQTGMLESQTVRFILLAGRSLLLDLMMLEALLVVDDMPSSSVFHINSEMVETQAAGSVAAPAWGTRPSAIDTSDWVRLQGSLFPERISISLCDCDLDLLDVTFQPSSGFDAGDVPPDWGLENAAGLLPYGSLLMWTGMLMGIAATSSEVRRFTAAQRLAEQFRMEHQGRWE